MKIIAMSDNHHDWKKVLEILKAEKYDFSIHLGDAEVAEEVVKEHFDKYVSGNHDDFSISEDVFDLEGIRFAILHGHTRGIGLFLPAKHAAKFGKSFQADIVIHGHTHIPQDEIVSGVRVICPGSVANPRSAYGKTYMIINVEKGKVVDVELKTIA